MKRKLGNRGNKRSERIIYTFVIILLVAVVSFFVMLYVYNKKLEEFNSINLARQITDIVPNKEVESENVNLDIGKKVEESKEELENSADQTKDENQTNQIQNEISSVAKENENNKENSEIAKKNEEKSNENKEESTDVNEEITEEEVVLNFEKPVEGKITKVFATQNLVYSETLKEWITHNGVDIKASQTTVVKAAESGTVKSIKNDPRYGLTVIIEHENGYESVYSNLLTAEFVVETENVEKGQTLGTVGSTATFEIIEEPHLHFEIKKDGEYIDPCLIITDLK